MIFVGNLAPHVTRDDVKEAFSQYGEVFVRMPKGDDGANHKGMCFVKFSSPEVQVQVMEEQHHMEIGGQRVRLDPAKPKKKDVCFLFILP